MVTIITLGVIGVVIAAVVGIILFLVGIPLMIIGSILPWVLTLFGVVMLITAALDKPFRWENFIPGLVALLASGLLRWLF